MNAAILCPGPSLAALSAPPQADLTIGINRACIRWPLDVWSALDHWCQTDPPGGIRNWQAQVIGSPILLTCKDSADALIRHYCPWRGDLVLIDDMTAWLPPPRGQAWTLYSATAALVYAGWKGAKRIDVYGADMTGQLDYDGAKAGSNRDETRWAGERVIFNATAEQLAERGIEVARHQSH